MSLEVSLGASVSVGEFSSSGSANTWRPLRSNRCFALPFCRPSASAKRPGGSNPRYPATEIAVCFQREGRRRKVADGDAERLAATLKDVVVCSRPGRDTVGFDHRRCAYAPRAHQGYRVEMNTRRTWLIAVRSKRAPGTAGGSCSCSRVDAYRLAWRLAPPLGPRPGPLPRMSPVETSLTQSEPLPL